MGPPPRRATDLRSVFTTKGFLMAVAESVLIVVTLAVIAADEPKKKDDAQAFQGNWSVVSMSMGGQPTPEAFVKNLRCKFEEKTYNNTIAGQVIEEGSYAIDPVKTPKTVDFEIKKGHDQGKKQLGIYKIEGDKLTLVLTQAGSTTRPDSFKIEAGAPMLEVVLERVKP
jgi:uncharacterized protein (TIGR03067 family)